MQRHKPVLLEESLSLLDLRAGHVAVDATLGSGGHARRIAEAVTSAGKLIGIDQDPASLARCESWAKPLQHVTLVRSNFTQIDKILSDLNISGLDAVLIDTGYSSDQMEDGERGLSFMRSGPLDMRLDPSGEIQAKDLVNDLSQDELEKIFREFGEERRADRFARVICDARNQESIETTEDLIRVLERALPGHFSIGKGRRPHFARKHFATRIFQALRIAVNHELENLEKGLKNFWNRLNYSGRIAIITFHSLEDRIVKQFFRSKALSGEAVLLCKKPMIPSVLERRENPRSRSAKLRGAQKVL